GRRGRRRLARRMCAARDRCQRRTDGSRWARPGGARGAVDIPGHAAAAYLTSPTPSRIDESPDSGPRPCDVALNRVLIWLCKTLHGVMSMPADRMRTRQFGMGLTP